MDFNRFKKQQKSSADLDRLAKAIEASTKTAGQEKDPRFWRPEPDKAGNASAIIRFLPEPKVDGEDALPWVSFWDHGFKGPGGEWYIEKSLTSLGSGHKDPVSEYNSMLWNSTDDDSSPSRKQARDQKRRLKYISNILVVSDPKHPENDGKVFLFQYGKKIYDKIDQMLHPQFEDDKPVSVFNFWTGCNFKLRMRKVEGYPNYDQSMFEAPSVIPVPEDEIEKIWESEYSLKEFVDPKTFKTYDQLKARLDQVLGLSGKTRVLNEDTREDTSSRSAPSRPVVKQASRKPAPELEDEAGEDSDADDGAKAGSGDDDLAYFRKLAEES